MTHRSFWVLGMLVQHLEDGVHLNGIKDGPAPPAPPYHSSEVMLLMLEHTISITKVR